MTLMFMKTDELCASDRSLHSRKHPHSAVHLEEPHRYCRCPHSSSNNLLIRIQGSMQYSLECNCFASPVKHKPIELSKVHIVVGDLKAFLAGTNQTIGSEHMSTLRHIHSIFCVINSVGWEQPTYKLFPIPLLLYYIFIRSINRFVDARQLHR